MNTNSFSFRRMAWLLKINGTFTLRSHLLWVACIVAAAVAVNLLLLYEVEKTFYVLFAIFCALPLFKIYPVKYGLKYQSLPCYLLIPASNSERFTVQMLLTVGIGLLYAFIGILLLFGCNQLLHSFFDGYPPIGINGFYEPLHEALCKAFLLPDSPMSGWCIALNICWILGFLIWILCQWPGFFVIGFIAFTYLYGDVVSWLHTNTGLQDFFAGHFYVAILLSITASAIFYTLTYRAFCKTEIRSLRRRA